MKHLIHELEKLKKGSIRQIIDKRMSEFSRFQRAGDSDVWGELCFCLMTANFQAEKSIKIQEALKDKFYSASPEEMAASLKVHGHRFPNTRAAFIVEARKHRDGLSKTLKSFSDDSARRAWLVKNVKGIGMKEASHFLRNIGYTNCAIIDFHIIDKLADAGAIERPLSKAITPKQYLEIERVLEKLGAKSGLSQAELDLYLWYAETGKVLK